MKLPSQSVLPTLLAILLALVSCTPRETQIGPHAPSATPQPVGQLYLYGEVHGVDAILDREFELWSGYYSVQGMRYLFCEDPYYTAQFLNLWMQAEDDEILDRLYEDSAGTLAHNPAVKAFHQRIKAECPDTIFVGTDIGHQFDTTGARYLDYLEQSGLEASEDYRLTQEAIEQGKRYYKNLDEVYRENTMAENYIRAYDALGGVSIMGIYGAAHTGLDAVDYVTGTVPCMANQLQERYGDALHAEDLSPLALGGESSIITVAGQDYEAIYLGKEDASSFSDYAYREFWRLEDAYGAFKDCPRPPEDNILPYDNYPVPVESGQVFVIDYTKPDGAVTRFYFRSDGLIWEGLPTTLEFIPGP